MIKRGIVVFGGMWGKPQSYLGHWETTDMRPGKEPYYEVINACESELQEVLNGIDRSGYELVQVVPRTDGNGYQIILRRITNFR